jgi:O-antigen ligase
VRRLGAGLAVVSVCSVAVLAVAGGPYIARQWQNFTALKVNENAATRFTDFSGYRYDLWRVALREFSQHPVGGLGAGNYDDEYYQLRRTSQYVIVPHSLELQMAAELGVGGVIALLLFCGAVLAACFARRGTLASTDRLVKVAAAGMFAAWLIDTSVDWTYDIPGLAGAAILAAALLVVPARSARAGGPRRSRRAQACAAVALAVLALLAASVGRQYAATRYQEAGVTDLAGSPRAALSTLAEAEKLDPYSLQTLYSLASAYAREDNYPRARDTLLQAQALEPENYVPPALLGDLATRRGDNALAGAEYHRALVLNPNDPELRQTGSRQ